MNTPREIKFSDEAFRFPRERLDAALSGLIHEMRDKNAHEGSVTLKIGVEMSRQKVTVPGFEQNHIRWRLVPKFDYSLKAEVKNVSQEKDTLPGGDELQTDPETGNLVLVRIDAGQTRMPID